MNKITHNFVHEVQLELYCSPFQVLPSICGQHLFCTPQRLPESLGTEGEVMLTHCSYATDPLHRAITTVRWKGGWGLLDKWCCQSQGANQRGSCGTFNWVYFYDGWQSDHEEKFVVMFIPVLNEGLIFLFQLGWHWINIFYWVQLFSSLNLHFFHLYYV